MTRGDLVRISLAPDVTMTCRVIRVLRRDRCIITFGAARYLLDTRTGLVR